MDEKKLKALAAEGLPGCDKQRLSTDAHSVVHHPYGAQQPEIHVMG